jgi:hypothetical protein
VSDRRRSCQAQSPSNYTLDRAHFASSTDWFLVDNYPTPKKANHKNSLIFRRFYFAYVDDSLREGELANTVSFVCQRKNLNSLLVHLPDAVDLKTMRPRNQWISKTELRVLTDDFATRFDAEYIDGDFFVDFNDETKGNLIYLIKSRFVTVEFGPGNERISLFTADVGHDGTGNLKGALRELVPLMAKSFGGNSRILSMSEMFDLCDDYKARPVSSATGKYWIIWGTASCPTCDPSIPGEKSSRIRITNKNIRSEKECLSGMKQVEQAYNRQGLTLDLQCIRVENPNGE